MFTSTDGNEDMDAAAGDTKRIIKKAIDGIDLDAKFVEQFKKFQTSHGYDVKALMELLKQSAFTKAVCAQ